MPTRDLIAGYLDYLRQLDRSPRTINERARILATADGELPYGLDAANDGEVRNWLLRPHWSRSTKQTYYNALHGFYIWCTEVVDALELDPTARIPRPHAPQGLPRPVTDDELQAVLTGAGQPYRLWALLAAYAGLRCCEIARLQREHVTEREILVHGKGGYLATVDTHPRVWHALRHLPPGPVERHTASYISARFGVHCREVLGLPGVTMHRLRHWCISRVQESTGDVRVTQQISRHRSLQSVMIYTHVSDERRRAAVFSLPAVADASCAGGPDASAAGR